MKKIPLALLGCVVLLACSQPKPEPEVARVETKSQPIEIGDARYAEIAKQSLKDLAEGNVEGFLNSYSDDARFYWNYGDSVIGKPAILEYWKPRRENVIDTLTYTRDLWVTLNAHESSSGLDSGTYVLAWYYATATYKATGKSMSQWIHQVHHFDANGKIDHVSQYADRLLIREALTKK
jgi:ketosteroid isomerase-like protein